MYVDLLLRRLADLAPDDVKGRARLATFEENLRAGIAHYRQLVRGPSYEGENLASLAAALDRQEGRLDAAAPRSPARAAAAVIHSAPCA